ncbi:hypothetical protein H9L39_20052 [Fusarium oxysporum f. sp. albedinis]|nr:hypothetical protein H9L39_20052 [Fusarium oxysporum f. sp. albedinis]
MDSSSLAREEQNDGRQYDLDEHETWVSYDVSILDSMVRLGRWTPFAVVYVPFQVTEEVTCMDLHGLWRDMFESCYSEDWLGLGALRTRKIKLASFMDSQDKPGGARLVRAFFALDFGGESVLVSKLFSFLRRREARSCQLQSRRHVKAAFAPEGIERVAFFSDKLSYFRLDRPTAEVFGDPEVIQGHSDIPGNEQADILVKAASALPEPEDAQPTLAHLRRIARQKPKEAFEAWWSTSAPDQYKRLNLKATTGCPSELSLPRAALHHLLAARSLHGDFAVYHERFNHNDARLVCSCGRRKAPDHIFYCRTVPPRQQVRLTSSPNAAIYLAIGRDSTKFVDLAKDSSFFGKIYPRY